MPSLIDRIKAQVAGQKSITQMERVGVREKTRKVVITNRYDDFAYQAARRTEKMGEIVHDLSIGDPSDDRPEFEPAPELVEALFQSAYKAAPQLERPRRLARELYPARRIAEEIQNNPRLKELHEFTQGDPTTSVVAVEAMMPAVKEILKRVGSQQPNPQQQPQGQPDPNQQPQGGGGGGGGGQPDPNAPPQQPQGGGGGQGQPDPNGQQGQGQGQGGGGQGQPDPNQQGQGGQPGQPQPGDPDPNAPEGTVPPPPEEKDAEEGDGSEYEQDLTNDLDAELDAEAKADAEESAWRDAWDKIIEEADVERMAHKALEAAERECEELDNLRKGIGMEDGEWAVMSPEERLAFVEQLKTPEMKQLADIVGRMRRFSLGVKHTRVTDVHHEAFNVETGNDLRRVLKPQLVLLANPLTSLEFFRRYADKELLQFKMRGTEDVGKGPIVLCIDKSGSMNGQPFYWALAVAESLRRFAAEDDRDMYVMFFGTNRDRVRFEFPKGKAPFEKVMTFLGTIANGGTAFDGVLTEALSRATEYFDGEGKDKADIVFITDGMANLSDQWINEFNAERDRVGVRMYSVYIGGSYDMRNQTGPLGLLEQISDATIPVSELKPEAVREVFSKV